MKKKILLSVAALLIAGISYGIYLYNKPHKDIAESKAELTITAPELIEKFTANLEKASTSLTNKIVEIQGSITTIEKTETSIIIILDQGVKCELKNESQQLEKGQVITIKGVYSGYDEMFNEISLIRCHLTN